MRYDTRRDTGDADMTTHDLDDLAQRHLWGHFSVLGRSVDGMRIMERGEGCYVWDTEGRRYLDAGASLKGFV